MMKKQILKQIAVFLTIISGIAVASCSFLQNRDGKSSSHTDEPTADIAKAIIGTWKLEAVNCDAEGKGCLWYEGTRVFTFTGRGEVEVNRKKRGTYRIEGTSCRLQTRAKEYKVLIRQIDTKRLITGEPFRSTTEIFRRIK